MRRYWRDREAGWGWRGQCETENLQVEETSEKTGEVVCQPTQDQEGEHLCRGYAVALTVLQIIIFTNEPPHDKTNKMVCAPSEDSDQPGHPPSLIRVFAVRIKKAWVLSYPLSAQRRLWSDWADAQVDLSLRWAHMPFCWFCHVASQTVPYWSNSQWTSANHFESVSITIETREIL